MTSPDWVTWNNSRKKRFDDLKRCIKNDDLLGAKAIIKSLTPASFVSFTDTDDEVALFCQKEFFEDTIKIIFKKFFTRIPEFDATRMYQPLTAYQMLKGHYFYSLATKSTSETTSEINFTKTELSYLEKSLNYGNYHALSALVEYKFRNFDPNNDLEFFTRVVPEKVKLNWTPGYILLSKVYSFLGKLSIPNNRLDFRLGLTALLIAEKISDCPHSKNAIYHTTWGIGLATFSKYSSWQDAIEAYKQKYSITIEENRTAEIEANQSVDLLLSSYLVENANKPVKKLLHY